MIDVVIDDGSFSLIPKSDEDGKLLKEAFSRINLGGVSPPGIVSNEKIEELKHLYDYLICFLPILMSLQIRTSRIQTDDSGTLKPICHTTASHPPIIALIYKP